MKVLGISCYFHDSAACLAVDGEPVVAIEEERLSRRKHDSSFPLQSIAYCLEHSGVSARELDVVCFYEKPLRKLERVLRSAKSEGSRAEAMLRRQIEALGREGLAFEARVREVLDYSGPVWFVDHHLAHAASAYYPSPFEDATVLTIDGVGEAATTGIFTARGGQIQQCLEQRYPHSLGLLYSAATAFLGFSVNNDEYKVMGLAAYGKPRFLEQMDELVHLRQDGSFVLNMRYFSFTYDSDRMYASAFEGLFGKARVPGAPVTERDCDFAASIQVLCERICLGLARAARSLDSGTENLCLAGGVALNGIANNRIAREAGFRRIFIQPAAGDGGCAMGAALWASNRLGAFRNSGRRHSTWLGRSYSQREIEAALAAAGLRYESFDSYGICRVVADLVADGKIVGWHQGRSEFGPRALGSRSILADPRRPDMQRILNARIKLREEFRPFAPAVLAERATEWFELIDESPFMLLVCPVKEDRRKLVPAITHVDGSARPQTVAEVDAPLFHRLICEFERVTGTPMMINTSFNLRGEPIVETPADACNTFLNTDIDYLAVGNCLATKIF